MNAQNSSFPNKSPHVSACVREEVGREEEEGGWEGGREEREGGREGRERVPAESGLESCSRQLSLFL